MLEPKNDAMRGAWTIWYKGKGGSVPNELLKTLYSSQKAAQDAINNYLAQPPKTKRPAKKKEETE